jgi:hypothetical protein
VAEGREQALADDLSCTWESYRKLKTDKSLLRPECRYRLVLVGLGCRLGAGIFKGLSTGCDVYHAHRGPPPTTDREVKRHSLAGFPDTWHTVVLHPPT